MPDFGKYFAGDYLKINENVKHGDNIKFLDVGANVGTEEEPKIEFLVMVMRDGEPLHQKKFTMNKTNYSVVKALYGSNSDAWVNKEVEVMTSKVRNPKIGMMVDGIVLVPPGATSDGEQV